MQKENTLGAPTEGLGQTVTFTASGVGVPQTQAEQRGGLRLGITGSPDQMTSRAQAIPEARPDATFTALAQLGGDMLKPHIEAERQAAYMRGVQQASSKQAITEIVDEQPWYAKLFGSTSLVDGARAYTASTKASDMVSSIEADMPKLRHLDGAAFAEHTSKLMNSLHTGDAPTDMMITQQSLAVLPHIMKAQAKANILYKKEVLGKELGNSIDGTSNLFRATDESIRNGDGSREAQDLSEITPLVDKMLTKPDSMEQHDFDQVVGKRIVGQVRGGNFALYNYLERDKLQTLPVDIQLQIERAHTNARVDARAKLPVAFNEKVANFRFMSQDGSTTEAQAKEQEAINKEYTRITGDRSKYISGEELSREFLQRRAYIAHIEAQQAAQEARNGNAAAKIIADQVDTLKNFERTLGYTSQQSGVVHRETLIGLPSEKQQAVFALAAQRMELPQRIQYLAEQAQSDIIDHTFQKELQTAGNQALAASDPIGFAKAYNEQYLPLVQHSGDRKEELAAKYAGSDLFKVMHKVHYISGGKPLTPENVESAYRFATQLEGKPLKDNPTSKVEKDRNAAIKGALSSGVSGSVFSALGRAIGMDEYPIENVDQAYGWLNASIPEHEQDPKSAVRIALQNSPDVSIVGNMAWTRGTRATDLRSWFLNPDASKPNAHHLVADGVAANNINKATKLFFDSVKSELQIDSGFSVLQMADKAGVPQLAVMGTMSNGDVVHKHFSAQDIASHFVEYNTSTGKYVSKEQPDLTRPSSIYDRAQANK